MHDLYRIERYVCSRGDDVQRSIELLDKVLSEYDEHEAEEVGAAEVLGIVAAAPNQVLVSHLTTKVRP